MLLRDSHLLSAFFFFFLVFLAVLHGSSHPLCWCCYCLPAFSLHLPKEFGSHCSPAGTLWVCDWKCYCGIMTRRKQTEIFRLALHLLLDAWFSLFGSDYNSAKDSKKTGWNVSLKVPRGSDGGDGFACLLTQGNKRKKKRHWKYLKNSLCNNHLLIEIDCMLSSRKERIITVRSEFQCLDVQSSKKKARSGCLFYRSTNFQ